MLKKLFSIFALLTLLSACAKNPVTGESQLMFSSFSDDVEIGQQQYAPALQSQGGEYNLDPKLTNYVSQVGLKLAAVSDVPKLPYEFVVLNNSVPNAWALPSGKIAINRGLLVQLKNEAQLAAVLSHEIVHAAARHGAQRMRDSMLMQAAMTGLGLGLSDNDYRDLIIGGASLGAQLTVAKYGRDHELESDEYGMKYMAKAGYDLQGAVELQKLFVEFSKGQKSSWIDGLFASHPPSMERVKANMEHAKKFSTGASFTGEREYQQALSYLHSKQEAYDLSDQAAKALKSGEFDTALSLITKAEKIEPREALFQAIKGDALAAKGDHSLALKAHSQATQLNPQQFSYFLKRAKSYAATGNIDYAIEDFKYSMSLLPTSVAALNLGDLYLTKKEEDMASKYYAQASSAAGNVGQQAQVKLARIELPKEPAKYLKAKHVQDPKGPLLVTIENHSPLTVSTLSLYSVLYDATGKAIAEKRWSIDASIEGGKRSPYFSVPVSYHLKKGEQVKTLVESVKSVE